MSERERIMRLMSASPKTLARIDCILEGRDDPAMLGTCGEGADDARLLTLSEAAQRLRLSRPTVYRLCVEGRLPFVQLSDNRGKRIRLRAVLDFANGTAGAASRVLGPGDVSAL